MFTLTIDMPEQEKIMHLSTYEEVDSIIQNLPEGSFWTVEGTHDISIFYESNS